MNEWFAQEQSMQHESPTRGMSMSALRRHKQGLDLADETVAIEVPGLNLFYGDKQALFDIALNIPKQKVTSFIRLWQINVATQLQSHERPGRWLSC